MPFREVIGHKKLVALLSRAVARETLPPSLILAGPSGVGKRLMAIAAAQALNCTALRRRVAATEAAGPPSEQITSTAETAAVADKNFQTLSASSLCSAVNPGPASQDSSLEIDACGSCSACVRIARGTHPDVLLIEPGDSGTIKIEQVREAIDRAAYRPFDGRRRVVIIDEADALVPAAQNALLKTLEEPPASSAFVLITARPDVLLPTVRSRCPHLRVRPLDAEQVVAVLMKRGRGEAEARAVAATADGSVGRALEASADDLVEAREVAVRVLAQAASSDDPRRRIEAARDLVAKAGASGAADRERLATHLRAMASLIRDVELLSTRADFGALANPDRRAAIERLSAFRAERGIRAFTAIDQALVALDRNAGVKTVADWVAIQI